MTTPTNTLDDWRLYRLDSTDRGTGPFAPVVRAEAASGGYLWVAYASPLPTFADGGAPATHLLVSVLHRAGGGAYVLPAGDGSGELRHLLTWEYVTEKFGRNLGPADCDRLGLTIATLLRRPYRDASGTIRSVALAPKVVR